MRNIELKHGDVLIHKGMLIREDMLDALTDATNKRLLWAFVSKGEDIMAVPYTEDKVIWMAESDILQPHEVEV